MSIYEHYFGSRTNEGDNILHVAAREGHANFIEVALNRLPVLVLLVCQSNNHGENPLHVAAELGRLDSATTPEEPEVLDSTTPTDPTEIQERNLPQDASKELQKSFNSLSVIAAMLTVVTFAAIFAIPGSFNQNGEPNLERNKLFKVFMLSNASAMCGYVLVLFCVLWAMMLTQHGEKLKILLTCTTRVLQLSFYATLVAFATGGYATLSAIVLVCLPSCVVILTLPKFLSFCLTKGTF